MRTYTLNLSTNSKTNPPVQNNGLNTQASWNINWREIFGNKTGECRVRAVLQTLCNYVPLPPSSIVFTTDSPTYSIILINWTGGLSQDANPVTMTFTLNGTPTTPASVGTGTATFTGLTASTTYTIIVTATTSGGFVSNTKIITTSYTILYTNSGVAISGFAYGNGGANSAILTTGGNPDGCISVGPQNYYYGTLGFSFLNTTIVFDAYGAGTNVSILNMFFGCNSSGAGQMLRMDFRGNSACGFATTTSWTTWSGPTGAIYKASNTWYTVKIQITSAGVATWYCNGVLQSSTSSTITMTNNGNYMAFSGDYSGTLYDLIDNFTMYSGIV